jgi:hypothetical protein
MPVCEDPPAVKREVLPERRGRQRGMHSGNGRDDGRNEGIGVGSWPIVPYIRPNFLR